MKRFNLRGTTAQWDRLNVLALNTKTGKTESATEMPKGKFLTVHIGTKEDSELAFTMAKERDYALMRDGEVIGWATFHRRRYHYNVRVFVVVSAEVTLPFVGKGRVGVIVDKVLRVRAVNEGAARQKAQKRAERIISTYEEEGVKGEVLATQLL